MMVTYMYSSLISPPVKITLSHSALRAKNKSKNETEPHTTRMILLLPAAAAAKINVMCTWFMRYCSYYICNTCCMRWVLLFLQHTTLDD